MIRFGSDLDGVIFNIFPFMRDRLLELTGIDIGIVKAKEGTRYAIYIWII